MKLFAVKNKKKIKSIGGFAAHFYLTYDKSVGGIIDRLCYRNILNKRLAYQIDVNTIYILRSI